MTGEGSAPVRARLHVRVEGRVQGVGFRWFVREAATTLGLGGWVRNLADGAVEVSAVGEPTQIRALRERIVAGPPHARVDRVVDLVEGAEPEGSTFEVLRDPLR